MLAEILELKQKNNALRAQQLVLVRKCHDEGTKKSDGSAIPRPFTSDEETSFRKIEDDYLANGSKIVELEKRQLEIQEVVTRREILEAREKEAGRLDSRRAGRDGGLIPAGLRGDGRHVITPEKRKVMRTALRGFLLGQDPGKLEEEARSFFQEHQVQGEEARALGLTGASGGFTIPQSFMPELDIALKDYSGVAQIARILDTSDGADMPWPTVNDSANAGHILTEGSAGATNVDPTFAAITLKAYVYTSDIVLIANQLIQDSAFNIDEEIGRLCGIRLGRILNTHCTTGTGTGQPKGIITAATLGKTAASATAVTYGEVVDLMHSVDPAYRAQRSAGWMMHDNILAILKKLLDSNGRPIFMPAGDAPGDVDRILNKPVYINQAMASAMTTGQKTLLFGMLDKYIIRRVMNVTVTVLRERYAEFFQTGVVTFMRLDGNLIDAGTNPVKYLAQA